MQNADQEMKNDHVDAYLLSESSMFVYPTIIVVKTCGVKTPLFMIQPLLEAARGW